MKVLQTYEIGGAANNTQNVRKAFEVEPFGSCFAYLWGSLQHPNCQPGLKMAIIFI